MLEPERKAARAKQVQIGNQIRKCAEPTIQRSDSKVTRAKREKEKVEKQLRRREQHVRQAMYHGLLRRSNVIQTQLASCEKGKEPQLHARGKSNTDTGD